MENQQRGNAFKGGIINIILKGWKPIIQFRQELNRPTLSATHLHKIVHQWADLIY